jgi:hypothetical protein
MATTTDDDLAYLDSLTDGRGLPVGLRDILARTLARLDALESLLDPPAPPGPGPSPSPFGGADGRLFESLRASQYTHPRRDEEVGGPISYATHPLASPSPGPDPWAEVRVVAAALRAWEAEALDEYRNVEAADYRDAANRLDAAARAARGEG